VSVALVFQQAMRVRHTIFIPCGLWLYRILPDYLLNGMMFEKKVTEQKMCVLSVQLLSEIFLRRTEQDAFINVHSSSHKVSVILVKF
jgi:hypothetical protein